GELCIEPARGRFNAAAFEEIDYALASARRHGIRVVPTIVGDDAVRGGSGCVYLGWRGYETSGCSLVSMAPFWTDPAVLGDVEEHIHAVLEHVNVYTHVAYKDDPTILGWDLLNGGGSPLPRPAVASGSCRARQGHADRQGWRPVPAGTSDPVTARAGESGNWWALYYAGIRTLVNTPADMAARAQIIRRHDYAMRGLKV